MSAPAAPATTAPAHAVVAEIVRSGFVEGRHHGSVVALDASGELAWSVGDPSGAVLPRSCNKPVQAVAMVRSGLELPPELLALATASHSAEDFHLAGVRRILGLAGLDESSLQCPPSWPVDEEERDAHVAAGLGTQPINMDCSGKHAAMLLTCVVNAWPTGSYLDPRHPLQQRIAEVFAELTGEPVAHVAVDGCGAPLLGTSLTGLARAFRRIAVSTGSSAEGEGSTGQGAEALVAGAIRTHPAYVSGTRRDEARLLAAVPGAIAKAGAEACYAVALPDGRSFALKIDDGGGRARPVVMAAALERAGVLEEPGVDADAVRLAGRHLLHGGGEPVGAIQAAL